MTEQPNTDVAEADQPTAAFSPFVADVFTAMFAASERTTNQVFDNYEAEVAKWKAEYVKLWDRVDRAAEVITTRSLENVLAETEWVRDNAARPKQVL